MLADRPWGGQSHKSYERETPRRKTLRARRRPERYRDSRNAAGAAPARHRDFPKPDSSVSRLAPVVAQADRGVRGHLADYRAVGAEESRGGKSAARRTLPARHRGADSQDAQVPGP